MSTFLILTYGATEHEDESDERLDKLLEDNDDDDTEDEDDDEFEDTDDELLNFSTQLVRERLSKTTVTVHVNTPPPNAPT